MALRRLLWQGRPAPLGESIMPKRKIRKPKPKARKPAMHEWEIPQGFLTVRSLARGLTGLAPTSEIMVAGPGGPTKSSACPSRTPNCPGYGLKLVLTKREIGRASCRERVVDSVGMVLLYTKDG